MRSRRARKQVALQVKDKVGAGEQEERSRWAVDQVDRRLAMWAVVEW